MPLVSVPAVYDGKKVRLLEPLAIQERYRVLATSVEPDRDTNISSEDRSRVCIG
jgi:hypothetical protein